MTLPANIILEKNKPNATSAWAVLVEATLTDGTVLRYARAHADLIFGRPYYTNNSVVFHYKLNDDLPTTTVVDSSLAGNHGAVGGGDDTEDLNIVGQIGGAFDFGGTPDYVDTGDPFQSTLRDSFSISFWMKPDEGQPGATQTLFGMYASSGTVSQLSVYLQSTGAIAFVYISADNAGTTATTDPFFASGAAAGWTHVVVVADSTVGGVGGKKIYINGELADLASGQDGSTSGVTFADFTTTNNLYMGALNDGGSPAIYYAGGIDNAMLFSKALSQAEITALYNSGDGTELVPTTYTAVAFGLDTTTLNNTGEIPTLNLNIHDVGLLLQPYLRSLNGAVGSTVRIIVASTAYQNEDLTELEMEFEVLSTTSNASDVVFRLGAPQKLMQRFPMERDFALFCQFRYETTECGYTQKSLVGYTLPSGLPVNIEATGHGFATGDSIRLDDVDDPTPSLDGTYDITWVGANNFTLDGTDGDDYVGAWSAGGTAGYATCPRSLTDCQDRENSTRFGGAPGLQQGGMRLV